VQSEGAAELSSSGPPNKGKGFSRVYYNVANQSSCLLAIIYEYLVPKREGGENQRLRYSKLRKRTQSVLRNAYWLHNQLKLLTRGKCGRKKEEKKMI
jgi:hypothetical protein